MCARRQFEAHSSQSQSGSALLIAIFALLLISVVGIALLVSTGTDSALAGNYRTSTSAYYAASAGLEEGRGRLLWRNPNYVGDANLNFLYANIHNVLYIVNPANGETVDPLDSSSPYFDREYASEYSWGLGSASVAGFLPSVSSIPGSPTIPGPLYKWVRINPVTELALNIDVDGMNAQDGNTPLFYSGSGLYRPGSGVPAVPPNGAQALEITAFAYMPDKSVRLLQYVVAPPQTLQYNLVPNSLAQGFPAALTIAGNGVSYVGPATSGYYINGTDRSSGPTCASPSQTPLLAIGYTNSADQSTIASGTASHPENYTGATPPPPSPATPSAGVVTLPPALQTPAQVESLIQTVTQTADVVLTPTPPATSVSGSALPSAMSPTNPMTVVVNGDLDLTSWNNTGYGVVLVTGNLNYDPDASWQGIILVLGKGTITGSRMGNGQLDGAIIVAQSRDPATGVVRSSSALGPSSVSFDSTMGGSGIYYNSCAILQAFSPSKFKIVSFREITPP